MPWLSLRDLSPRRTEQVRQIMPSQCLRCTTSQFYSKPADQPAATLRGLVAAIGGLVHPARPLACGAVHLLLFEALARHARIPVILHSQPRTACLWRRHVDFDAFCRCQAKLVPGHVMPMPCATWRRWPSCQQLYQKSCSHIYFSFPTSSFFSH